MRIQRSRRRFLGVAWRAGKVSIDGPHDAGRLHWQLLLERGYAVEARTMGSTIHGSKNQTK